jgi:hypothetical protein
MLVLNRVEKIRFRENFREMKSLDDFHEIFRGDGNPWTIFAKIFHIFLNQQFCSSSSACIFSCLTNIFVYNFAKNKYFCKMFPKCENENFLFNPSPVGLRIIPVSP